MNLNYRQAQLTEHDKLRAVVRQSYGMYKHVLAPEHWATMERNLENAEAAEKLMQSAVVFICADGETLAGVVYLVPGGQATPYFSADWAHIRQLGVLPDYRGLGIAEELMKHCVNYARKRGEKTLALHTSAYQSAWRLYERLGFIRHADLGLICGEEYWLYLLTL